MKRLIIATMALLTALSVAQAVEVDTDIGVYSAYVWRGQKLDDKPVVQGGITVSTNGFYFNVWGNYSLSDQFVGKGSDQLNEVDYTIGYGGTLDIVDFDLGYIYYNFPNSGGGADTSEIYAGLALNNLPVTPSVYVYYDLDEVGGIYVVGDLNYSKDLSEALSMEVGASLAWADTEYQEGYYGGRDSSSLADGKIYAGLNYALSENLSAGVSIAYSYAADGSLRNDAADAGVDDENVVGGLNLAYSF